MNNCGDIAASMKGKVPHGSMTRFNESCVPTAICAIENESVCSPLIWSGMIIRRNQTVIAMNYREHFISVINYNPLYWLMKSLNTDY